MKVFDNFDLTNYNSYRLSARCKLAYFPENEEDIITFFHQNNNYILLGSGHNIIFSRDYYDVPFLIFNGNFDRIELKKDGLLEVESGAMMHNVAKIALDYSLTGIEIFWDIPSSLGGAVVMNAGASGEEIKDVLVKVRYLDLQDLETKEIAKEDMSFDYRNSFFQRNTDKVVLRAWLQLATGRKDVIWKKMETVKAQRGAKQPKDLPNSGSVFKRPKGYYVGAIIDELGLKGYTVGGAKISEKHGGFIVNFNRRATGQDILTIISEVRKQVREKIGIELEVEQRVI